jgi:hypothetical protein
MEQPNRMVKLYTRIPSRTASKLREYCRENDYPIQEVVSDAIQSYLIKRQAGSKP